MSGGFGLSAAQFADVFPFHFVIGRDLRIRQVGRALAAACPEARVGRALGDALRLTRPVLDLSFEHLAAQPRAIYLFAACGSDLMLRGQMMSLDADTLAFLGGPWVTEVAAVTRLGLSLSDLPVHDPLPDLLFLLQGKNTAITDAKHLAERLRAQTEALQAANAQLRAILETAADGIVSIDERGTVQSFNGAAARMFGYEPPEVIGRNVSMLMSASDAAAHDGHLARYLRGAGVGVVGIGREVQGRRSDGTLFPLYLAVSEVQIGGRRTFTGILRDLSAAKRAAVAQQESEQRMRLVVATALDAFIGMDAEGRINEWSPHAEALFGWRREEVLGAPLGETIVPAAMRDGHASGLRRFLATGAGPVLNRRIEVTAVRRDGSEFPAELSVAPLRLGDTYSFSGFVRDITERKRAEAELRAAKELAEAASGAKSEFLATMSHEIRTPMNAVIGMAGLLLDTRLDAAQREYAQTVRQSAEALLTIINDILDFSKVEAGQLHIEAIDFAPGEVVREVLELFRSAAADRGVALTAEIDPAVPQALRGDPGRLRQVLTNLVSNALKFTPAGGVRIDARVADAAAAPGEAGLRFAVADTGIGIPADALPRLFEPFSQADGSTTRRYGGTGLGLAISKRLCELMGGEIGVDSRPGHGSTFWFTIRCGAAASAAVARPAARRETRARINRIARVLVAEDNAVNQRVAVLMLKRLGCRADAVGNGLEVLDALARHPYDLVLMDCHMPEMDGYDASAEVRRREQGRTHVPIVAMTASAMRGDRERCLAAGMDDYLAKPVREDELEQVVTRWLPASEVAEQAMAGWAAEPTLDLAALRTVAQIDRSVVDEIVALFERQTPEEVAAIGAASEDLEELGRLAHRLRGTCIHVGARRMAAVCGSLEAMRRSGQADPATVRAALAVLEDEFDSVCRELAAARTALPDAAGSA